MDRPRVFIGERIPIEVEKYIGKFCDYEKWDSNEKIPRDELLRKLRDKDGVILSSLKIDEELLDNSPKLRAVSNISVGYNNFDLNAMKKRNVIGTNTPGILDDTVADLIMGIILSAARRIPELDKYVKDGKWKIKDYENLYGVDVHHSTIGIIGMGRIGEALAKRAKLGFDAEVIYYNRNRRLDVEEKLGVRYCNFKELFRRIIDQFDFPIVTITDQPDTDVFNNCLKIKVILFPFFPYFSEIVDNQAECFDHAIK